MILAQHLCSTNDTNGNPRRVWTYQLLEDGMWARMVACIDEGYAGKPHVNGKMREGPYTRHRVVELAGVSISPTKYKEYLRWGDRLSFQEEA